MTDNITPELEAMAKAMFIDDFDGAPEVEAYWLTQDPETRDTYISNARAALLSLREPTRSAAQTAAGKVWCQSCSHDVSDRDVEVAADVFTTIIDHILGEARP